MGGESLEVGMVWRGDERGETKRGKMRRGKTRRGKESYWWNGREEIRFHEKKGTGWGTYHRNKWISQRWWKSDLMERGQKEWKNNWKRVIKEEYQKKRQSRKSSTKKDKGASPISFAPPIFSPHKYILSFFLPKCGVFDIMVTLKTWYKSI